MAKNQISKLVDKRIVIDFSKLPLSEDYSEGMSPSDLTVSVDMTKRRVFHKTIDNFFNEITNALINCPSIVDGFFVICKNIESGEYYSEEKVEFAEMKKQLVEDIDNYIQNDSELINYILNFVEENYNINIETNNDKNKDNHLQFTNLYAKRIFSATIMSRITFPILCMFMYHSNIKKEEVMFLELINKIFSYFNFDENGAELDLLTKIQKFVATSVDNTLYSDRIIWNYLKNQSVTEKTVAIDIHRNLLHSIIPKLELDKSVVAFFHVIIKKQVEYQFTSKFDFTYKPISIIQTGNDSINPFIKIEEKLLKNNSELSNIIIKLDIANYINAHSKLTKEEFDYHVQNVVVHTAQTRILGFFLNKEIGRGIPIMSLNREEYIKVLFIAKEWFEKNNYGFISYILLGKPIPKVSVKRNFNKGKYLLEITQSKVYKSIAGKYTHLGSKVDQETIINFIGSIINTDFEFYTLPDGEIFAPVADDSAQNSLKKVIVELLTFVNSL